MLLTIKQPVHQGYKSFHDYTPPTPPSTSRFSPAVATTGPSFPPISATIKSLPPIPASKSTTQQMSTPHRGLPPPAAMTLPQPSQQPPPIGQPPLSQPMGQLPAPPQQWQGAEESMRNWLHAKAEEDKRKQEEEKTRQEALRLEQRKIEQDMLRTSLNGGIPPYMIPMVFAGMGGGNLPNASLEWAQHYMSHLQQQQQIQQQPLLPSQGHPSPEQIQRRDSRATQPHAGQPHQAAAMTLPSTPIGPPSSQSGSFYPMSPATRSRSNTQTQGIIARPPATRDILCHNRNQLNTKSHSLPPRYISITGNHRLLRLVRAAQINLRHLQASIDDHTYSPKKRKATGPQQPAPPPTSQPQYTSPQFSQTGSSVSNTPSSRRRGHSRQRSDLSARGIDSYRPSSRQRPTESGFATQGMALPPAPVQGAATFSSEPRQRSGGANPVSSILEQSDSRPQSRQQSQQAQHDSRYSAGPEMRHDERRTTPKEE
ncbi:hypothetical protein D0Z07_8897 [Hyphodiscus hymeniophilus]|uniref:Uncharacterized protein n=1 Tax=Hyphodiscus hymeniophilus TaxID=353542 RepID=A0A9P6SMR9_9HELO|nr:hypothetical protein D0Z07_8897 [Hyphodiscus hymeniophilus]